VIAVKMREIVLVPEKIYFRDFLEIIFTRVIEIPDKIYPIEGKESLTVVAEVPEISVDH
jgi:hypothetical protein